VKIDGIEVHASVTADRVMEVHEETLASLESPGICIACGADAEGVEPDAEKYECESCGERAVYGVEQLVIIMA